MLKMVRMLLNGERIIIIKELPLNITLYTMGLFPYIKNCSVLEIFGLNQSRKIITSISMAFSQNFPS